ncbi:Sulfate transporter 2.1 [Citrus sinensis]|uniref:Sulfate transporter 2.1 n=1 Tax=Citrus sinensis TaxID=2711 RepID=A0ACB8KQJ8_CITSI|nr:Sulfate transporter 2.1 [Citrus sinensis]
MGSLPTESLSVEEHQQQQVEMDDTSRTERARWLLNSPDPPSIWHELAGSIREAFFPRNKLSSSSRVKQTWRRSAFSFLRGLFPILNWGRNYKASKFKSDLMAGLTLASLSIPQSIGYANLAKLDPQYGLYTSVIPPLIYALMGSSREIAIGPVAVVSMLLSALMQNVQDPAADPVAYRKLVFTVTFFAGVFQSVFGLFRLGFLVDFLSHAAIVGFMAGAAIVIGLQQLKGLLGISHFTNKTDVVSVLGSVFSSLHHSLHNLTIPSLLCDFLAVLVSSEFRPRLFLPYLPLNCKVYLYLTKADKHGVKIVKHIKGGLNPSSAHQLQLTGPHLGQTAKIGLISAVVALTVREAIAVGRSFASIKGYHLDGNKEMVAMGFMNIAGSLTSCYVATGSFSRTAVNFSAGCQTVVSNIVMAITVLLSLELFTSLLYYTPIAILASIILSALPGLIDINEAINIYKVDKLDFLACIGAFLGVLFASVEIGLLAAVTISFAKILLNAVRPGIELQGRLPRTDTYGDISQFPMAIKTPGILTIRINSALFCFANANFIRERIMRWVTEEQDELEETTKRTIQAVIIDMSNLMNIDTSGILVLEELHKKLASNGIELVMASPRWQVIHKLKSAKLLDRIGKGCVYLSVAEAMEACLASKFAALSNC